jgi:hypothetical protein
MSSLRACHAQVVLAESLVRQVLVIKFIAKSICAEAVPRGYCDMNIYFGRQLSPGPDEA